MNYKGCACPICGQSFNENDDIVVCPVCGTPQHRSCWKDNNGCINADKHTEGYIWQLSNEKRPENEALTIPNGDYKTCPRCGKRNSPVEPVCSSCGERLRDDSRRAERPPMPDITVDFGDYTSEPDPRRYAPPYSNVYATDAKMVFGENATVGGIPVTEAAEYIQKNSTEYIAKFKKSEENHTKLSWNWSAGIFSAIWCCYRRMVGLGIALVALFFSAYIISNTVPAVVYEKYNPAVYEEYEKTLNEIAENINSAMSDKSNASAMSGVYDKFGDLIKSPITITSYVMLGAQFLLISVVFGFLANSLYKKHMIKDVKKIRTVATDSSSYHMYLRQKGGVSPANVLLPILCFMILNMLLTYL